MTARLDEGREPGWVNDMRRRDPDGEVFGRFTEVNRSSRLHRTAYLPTRGPADVSVWRNDEYGVCADYPIRRDSLHVLVRQVLVVGAQSNELDGPVHDNAALWRGDGEPDRSAAVSRHGHLHEVFPEAADDGNLHSRNTRGNQHLVSMPRRRTVSSSDGQRVVHVSTYATKPDSTPIRAPLVNYRHLAARVDAFIAAARAAHDNCYDYSRVRFEYTNASTPVTIEYPDHGTFTQSPNEHRRGQLCPDCARLVRAAMFVERARDIHGDRYDYTAMVFVDQHTSVVLVCADHGKFVQRPTNHLSGHGCPDCAEVDRSDSLRAASATRKLARLHVKPGTAALHTHVHCSTTARERWSARTRWRVQ